MTAERIAVVGAGISGLTFAYRLREEARTRGHAVELSVLESAPEVGGHVRTIREDGFVVEGGPNGFLDREPAVTSLIRALGLEGRLVDAAPESARRYILRRGALHRVPDSAGALLGFGAMTLGGRLRLALEPFAPGPPAGVEETVFDFARRRIGREGADVLVDTAVSGISAGDSRRLSAPAQFPLMIEMERSHGSLLRAMIARRRKGIGASKLKSFDGGIRILTDRLAGELGHAVRTRAAVAAVSRDGAHWRVALESGDTISADRVVMAVPASVAARALLGLDPELSHALTQIESAPVAVSAFAFRKRDIRRPLDGYGYLVTRDEGLATLGVLWESSLFPHRAPEGMVLLRVMLGGARCPRVASLDPGAVAELALGEMRSVMGIVGDPTRSWRFAGRGAIAQYTLGHLDRIVTIRRLAARYPGLAVCGTSYDGVSFGAAIASASALAEALAARRAAA